MPIKKEIVYPIFLEACQYVKDTFWKNVFEDLAYGHTPYGTYITKGFLRCNYKDKEFSYKIDTVNPEKLHTEVYNLLHEKLGLLSDKDKLKKKHDFYNLEQDTHKTWATIRKKNIKDLLIENYVVEMKQKHGLSVSQTRYLLSTIMLCLIFKVITAKDIQYKNGQIEHIDGIDITRKKISLTREISDSLYTAQPSYVIIENNLMSLNWPRYLDGLRKLILKP